MKRNIMKKIACSFLVCLLCVMPLVSCSSDKAAMTYGSSVVTERMYRYWATQFKQYVMESFAGSSDTDAFWSQDVGGMTMEDYTNGIIQVNIKKNLVCMELFEEFGLTLSEDAVAAADADMADLIESYGSKSALNHDLANYGINADILREIYLIQEKISAVYAYMESTGMIAPSDEVLEQYYLDHYARIKYITIVMANIEGEEDGKVAYSSLSEAELAEKNALIDDIMAQLEGGADFDELLKKYGETDMTGYENGVYISTNNAGYKIIDEALDMEIGEIRRIDQDAAAYITVRLELEKKPYLNDKMGQFADLGTYCADEVFQNMLTEYGKDIEVNDSVVGKYSVRDVYYGK